MELVVVAIAALLISGLTLFSGFGLGTLLMPVFAFFFPIEVAVAITAIVHMANNAFKVPLFVRSANWSVILRFGAPAVVAALAGSLLLTVLAELSPLYVYQLGSKQAVITPVKATLAVLIVGFALFELLPRFQNLEFHPKYLPAGGVLSGFFGGLSGHQGAFRAAFLVRCGLSPEGFVATSAMIAFLVDLTRLSIYGSTVLKNYSAITGPEQVRMMLVAIIAAFAGTFLGKRYIGKVTTRSIQLLTGILLLITATLLGSGLV